MAHYVGYFDAISDFVSGLDKGNIRTVNIYGAGFICYLLLKYLSQKSITVNHLFDSAPDIISSEKYGYLVEDLFLTDLSSGDVVLVASDKYAEEIAQRLNNYSFKNNVKLTVLFPAFNK